MCPDFPFGVVLCAVLASAARGVDGNTTVNDANFTTKYPYAMVSAASLAPSTRAAVEYSRFLETALVNVFDNERDLQRDTAVCLDILQDRVLESNTRSCASDELLELPPLEVVRDAATAAARGGEGDKTLTFTDFAVALLRHPRPRRETEAAMRACEAGAMRAEAVARREAEAR